MFNILVNEADLLIENLETTAQKLQDQKNQITDLEKQINEIREILRLRAHTAVERQRLTELYEIYDEKRGDSFISEYFSAQNRKSWDVARKLRKIRDEKRILLTLLRELKF